MILRACGWVTQFVKATLLLTMSICGMEVGLRVWEAYAPEHSPKPASSLSTLLVPSARQYQELIPRIERTWPGTNGQTVRFRTNSRGGRGEELQTPKPQGTFRVLWLGNETVLAPMLDESLTPPHLVRTFLQTRSPAPVEIINGGFPESCPLLMALKYMNDWASTEPDLILIHVDRSAIERDRQLRRFTHASVDGRPLCCTHPSLTAPSAAQPGRDWRERWRLIDLTIAWTAHLWHSQTAEKFNEDQLPTRSPGSFSSPDSQKALISGTEHTLRPIQTILDLAKQSNTPVIVITSPVSQRTPEDQSFAKLLSEFCQSHRLPLINATSTWNDQNLSDAMTTSPAGNQQQAAIEQYSKIVAQTLLENWPGPWRGNPSRPVDENRPSSERQPLLTRESTSGLPPQILRPSTPVDPRSAPMLQDGPRNQRGTGSAQMPRDREIVPAGGF